MNIRRAVAALAAWVLLCGAAPSLNVTGVASNDTLALRAAPDAKSAKTGSLSPNATGLTITAVDSKGVDWVKVQKGGAAGWVNAKFLQYANMAPVKLTCQGTEPFWNMSVGYGVARFTFDGKSSTYALDEPGTPAARPTPWVYPMRGKAGGFLLAAKPDGKCSDGMSDNKFPYSMLVRSGAIFMEGCCK